MKPNELNILLAENKPETIRFIQDTFEKNISKTRYLYASDSICKPVGSKELLDRVQHTGKDWLEAKMLSPNHKNDRSEYLRYRGIQE